MKLIRVLLVVVTGLFPCIHSFAASTQEESDVYSVQLLTSKKHLDVSDTKFKGVQDISEENINGVFKYTTGKLKGFSEAAELMTKMKDIGFADAFVVHFRDGKRVTVKTENKKMSAEPAAVTPSAAVKEETEPISKPGGKEKPIVGSAVTQTGAEFPGGADSLSAFIRSNIHYPEQRIEKPENAKVLVSFIVDSTGKIKDSRVVLSVNTEVDAEALRIVNMMPDWKPGTAGGSPVEKEILLPINFYKSVGFPAH